MGAELIRIPVENFAFEILADIPDLLDESPTGITIQQLHAYYGDSSTRIWRALTLLEQKHHIKIYQTSTKKVFFLPADKVPLPYNMGGLSELQRNTIMFILNLCRSKNTDTVQTNYSQLARILKCSATGIRTCIARLIELEYLQIIQHSAHGKQSDLILGLGPELQQPTEINVTDHQEPS